MNTTQTNNKSHQDALNVTANFVKSGGKIIKPGNNYVGKAWEGMKTKKQFMKERR